MDMLPSEATHIVLQELDADPSSQALNTGFLNAMTRSLRHGLGQEQLDSYKDLEKSVVPSASDDLTPVRSSSNTIIGPNNQVSSVCARLDTIFKDLEKYKKFLANRDEAAKDLLDLLQKLLDHASLDSHFRVILYVALVRLCRKSELYPRCFSLADVTVDPPWPLSHGGFGDIYRGQYNGRTVSIKAVRLYEQSNRSALEKVVLIVFSIFWDDSYQEQAYSREAVVWGQLSHPNVLPFYGISHLRSPRRICLVSPWMSNGNIKQFLDDPTRSQMDRTPLISDAASGMKYLHDNGVVHGDLKSLNILVTESGRACLADFGLSYVAQSGGLGGLDLSSFQAPGGTPGFEAPELAKSDILKRTNESDVFAFGMVCFEIFTGELPYNNNRAATRKVMEGARPMRPTSHVHVQRGLTDNMWALMERCWSQLPEDRPTAAGILQALPPLETSSQRESWGEYARAETPGFGMEPDGQLDATIARALVHL